jgi:hypothetical protein
MCFFCLSSDFFNIETPHRLALYLTTTPSLETPTKTHFPKSVTSLPEMTPPPPHTHTHTNSYLHKLAKTDRLLNVSFPLRRNFGSRIQDAFSINKTHRRVINKSCVLNACVLQHQRKRRASELKLIR